MAKNIPDLMKSVLETLAVKQANGLSALEAHKALIEESIAKENKQKNVIIEDETPTSYLLPFCDHHFRPIPNAILRSALFGVVAKGKRKYEENVLKASVNGLTIKYTGQQLDQLDLDVWVECVHRHKGLNLGEPITFSTYNFLKSIGRKTGKSEYEWLRKTLMRLHVCAIEIGDGRFFYVGHLLHEWRRDEETGENIIVLNSKLADFFSVAMWTGISIKERMLFKNKPLTQWLHSFYSTHRKPFGYKVENLRNLCGSNILELKKFKYNLKKSLIDLSNATGWECSIDKNNLVHVKRK